MKNKIIKNYNSFSNTNNNYLYNFINKYKNSSSNGDIYENKKKSITFINNMNMNNKSNKYNMKEINFNNINIGINNNNFIIDENVNKAFKTYSGSFRPKNTTVNTTSNINNTNNINDRNNTNINIKNNELFDNYNTKEDNNILNDKYNNKSININKRNKSQNSKYIYKKEVNKSAYIKKNNYYIINFNKNNDEINQNQEHFLSENISYIKKPSDNKKNNNFLTYENSHHEATKELNTSEDAHIIKYSNNKNTIYNNNLSDLSDNNKENYNNNNDLNTYLVNNKKKYYDYNKIYISKNNYIKKERLNKNKINEKEQKKNTNNFDYHNKLENIKTRVTDLLGIYNILLRNKIYNSN